MLTQLEGIDKKIVIEKYIPLVKHIAGKVIMGKSRYIEYDDLVGYGMLGLMDAFNKFNPDKGIKFSTYASIRIKGAMIDEMRRNSPISKGAMDKLNKYNQALEVLQTRLLREPTYKEIAEELKISDKEVSEIERYTNYISMISLDTIIFTDDEVTINSVLEDTSSPRPEKILEGKEEIDMFARCIDKLNERDRTILSLYYYEDLTLKAIGNVIDVSESRVCQLHSRAISNLKKVMKEISYI